MSIQKIFQGTFKMISIMGQFLYMCRQAIKHLNPRIMCRTKQNPFNFLPCTDNPCILMSVFKKNTKINNPKCKKNLLKNHHFRISLYTILLCHWVSHTSISMFMRDEADCVLCGQHTKAEEGVFIIETKCSPWGMSWCWGNSSASSM